MCYGKEHDKFKKKIEDRGMERTRQKKGSGYFKF